MILQSSGNDNHPIVEDEWDEESESEEEEFLK